MNKSLLAVVIASSMATGYRRAGVALEQGENTLEVTEEQYQQLGADPRLAVSLLSELDDVTPPETDDKIEALVAVLTDLGQAKPFDKKPTVDELKFVIAGVEVKPTAAERDTAWELYQTQLDNS